MSAQKPDEIGIGGVSCGCEHPTTLDAVRATWCSSFAMQCPNCGKWVEALAVPAEPTR